MRQYTIGKRLVEGYLYQPYSWFLSRHSADIGKTILAEVNQVVASGIYPLIDLVAKVLLVIALMGLLILTDPKLSLIIIFFLGGSYLLIFFFIRKFLNRIGKERLKSNQLRFVAITEAFSAAKEIKVGGLENTYVERFSDPAQNYAKTSAYAQVIRQLPRFILEAVAFGGVILVILYLMMQKGTFGSALPIISLYVFAGYRLLPALQTIYSSSAQLTFVGPSLDKLYEDIKSIKPFSTIQDQENLSLNKKIILKNIDYNYPNTSRTALKNISFEIPAKTTVGLVGATGSGKTTIADIILGLLEAQKGSLQVDDQIITKKNLRAWQSSIGYVPQHIYLADDTVAANVAFGIDPKNINQHSVENASKIANLHDFVTNELPKKYQTTIGENGVRLSGGQRQRIGIARALYYKPQVLILDEATSALDNQTEENVMDAVKKIGNNVTIIIIAHRLNTVKNCDIIFKFEKGELISQGKFNKIINSNNY
jgi:ABC-type bacteriocin/lantibiotic exporter with double-glycine peptidase domain